ncbi:hypothetical protein L3Y34_019410 [Caenorhabditis briggsae]|uniref:Uncharacterized protein n=1 Tax=Caenorhabditis briggsae TaxID=6238 RepID=A0AAE9DPT0_CAEBR|nr:hypothetical protein L3Y34_019410 [Caenorhabditis briggsae]
MACVRSKCGDEDVISILTDVHDSSPISGPPGSECSPDRKANGKGLCTQEYSSGGYARKGIFDDIVKYDPPIVWNVPEKVKWPVEESEEDAVPKGPISIVNRETLEQFLEVLKKIPTDTSHPVRIWEDEIDH